jgi:hypothetical protein
MKFINGCLPNHHEPLWKTTHAEARVVTVYFIITESLLVITHHCRPDLGPLAQVSVVQTKVKVGSFSTSPVRVIENLNFFDQAKNGKSENHQFSVQVHLQTWHLWLQNSNQKPQGEKSGRGLIPLRRDCRRQNPESNATLVICARSLALSVISRSHGAASD